MVITTFFNNNFLLCPESGTTLPENQGNVYFRYQNDGSQLPPKIPQKMW